MIGWERGGYVSISSGFLCLLCWLWYVDGQNVLPWALLACFCHELGHYVAIYLCGGRVARVSLTMVGAEMEMRGRFSYGQDLYCNLAGPLVNLLLAFWFCYSFPLFSGLNLALALVNLFPMSRLDGGRALGCVMALCCPYGWGERVQEFCDLFCGGLVVALGMLLLLEGGSVTLLILGLWLCLAVE